MSSYTPHALELTDAQIDALPPFAREIIRHQRALEAMCCKPVVVLREAQNALDRRAFLARSAERQWVNADLQPTR
jgi:hypothetical protein